MASAQLSFRDVSGGLAPRASDGTWMVSASRHTLIGAAVTSNPLAAMGLIDFSEPASAPSQRVVEAFVGKPACSWVVPVGKLVSTPCQRTIHVRVMAQAPGGAPRAVASARAVLCSPESVAAQLDAAFREAPPMWWVQPMVAGDPPTACRPLHEVVLQMTSLELSPGPVSFRIMLAHASAALFAGIPAVLGFDVWFDDVLVCQTTTWACDSHVDVVLDPGLVVRGCEAGTVVVRIYAGAATSVVRVNDEDRPGVVLFGEPVCERLYVYTVI